MEKAWRERRKKMKMISDDIINDWLFQILPVARLIVMLELIQYVVDDSNIYCREILSLVRLVEHLYKQFLLVWRVLNCFYLWKEIPWSKLLINKNRNVLLFLLYQAMTRLNVLYPIRPMRKHRYWMNNDMIIYHRQSRKKMWTRARAVRLSVIEDEKHVKRSRRTSGYVSILITLRKRQSIYSHSLFLYNICLQCCSFGYVTCSSKNPSWDQRTVDTPCLFVLLSVDVHRYSIDQNKLNDVWRDFYACRIANTLSCLISYIRLGSMNSLVTFIENIHPTHVRINTSDVLIFTRIKLAYSMLTGSRGRWRCWCCIVSTRRFGTSFTFITAMFLITHPRINFFCLR